MSIFQCWACMDRPDGAVFVTGVAADGMIALDCGHERPALAEYEGLVQDRSARPSKVVLFRHTRGGDKVKVVATTTAARRCSELLRELPERSEYLEACRDFYLNADGIERATNLDAVLRAAARDRLLQGPEHADGVSQRRTQKGSHRIVLPGVRGPVRTPAWRHFETRCIPPSYSLVEVTMPDRAVESVEIAGTQVRPTGPRAMTVVCFGDSAKVEEWIQSQRGRHAKAKTRAEVWAYYRSCGIEAVPAAWTTARRLPEYACCICCRELIGPNGCVNENCREQDCTWLNELSGEPDEGDL